MSEIRKLLEMHVNWAQFEHLVGRLPTKTYVGGLWDVVHRDELPPQVQSHLNQGGRVALVPHVTPPDAELAWVDPY